jgi:thioredoxin-like negative regulator of GroEL
MDNLNEKDIDKFIKKRDATTVLFYADWCPFCRKFKPIFENYEKAANARFGEAKINEDDNPMWDRFSISVIPTLVAFKNGKAVARRDGVAGVGLSETDLKSIMDEIQ